jgi:uncharacterized protein (UPF0276 family)
MKFAVNYSQPAERFLGSGEIAFDLFKLPAWPDLVDRVSAQYPGYVHFPFCVSSGRGEPFDFDNKQRVTVSLTESFLAKTRTPMVNIHLAPQAFQHPDIDPGDLSTAVQEKIIERMSRDVAALIDDFGAEKVIAENDAGGVGVIPAALLPQVIHRVITQTGCGFLFDLSHARLAARQLGMDAREYIAGLPTHCLRELHITGIQYFDGNWQTRLRAAGMEEKRIARYANIWMDHLPLTGADWGFTAWAMNQIHSGTWNEPWVASCEYGGVGGFFEATMDADILRDQFPIGL